MPNRVHSREKKARFFKRQLLVLLGSLFVAVGLDLFLIPNSIIDGGIIGIAIMLAVITKVSVGIYLFFLNLPFLFIGYNQIGKSFAISTLVGITGLSVFTTLLKHNEAFTDQLILASVFGGIILGLGVGLIIRYGGSLDGTEIIAILATRKWGFSVGEVVMFFNIFILGSAGFVFGWDRAMYSLISYFIAFKMIDIVIEGLDESKSVTIISDNPRELAEAIMDRLGRGVTYVYGRGAYTGEEKELLYCIVTRLELAKLKSIVEELDPGAFVAIEHVHDVMGGRFNRKKAIH